MILRLKVPAKVVSEALKKRRTDREGRAGATSEARVGKREGPITRINIAAFSIKFPASDPNQRRFSPERARIRNFLVKVSTQFLLRAFWAISEANQRECLISDPGVSLYGILPAHSSEGQSGLNLA